MITVKLERFCYSDFGTFGYLYLPNGEQLATVERPWIGNQPRVSCIPIGEYDCEPRRYNKGGYDAVEVLNVPKRTHILLHIGNYVRNSNGCILINSRHGAFNQEWCGSASKKAFRSYMEQVGNIKSKLIVYNKECGFL